MLARYFFVVMLSCFLASCSGTKVIDLKSPCVSGRGGPCERISINDWWLKDKNINKTNKDNLA